MLPGDDASRSGEPDTPAHRQCTAAADVTDGGEACAGFADDVFVNEVDPPQGHFLEAKLADRPSAPHLQAAVGAATVMRTRRRLGTSNYAATRKQVSLAKGWVRTMFDGVVDDDALYDLTLCAAELVDNGRKHGRPDGVITVTAYVTEDTAQLEVINGRNGKTVPHITNNLETTHGHGLKIVSTLATSWGSRLTDDLDQVVWCEFSRIIEEPDVP